LTEDHWVTLLSPIWRGKEMIEPFRSVRRQSKAPSDPWRSRKSIHRV
jgi:hypothetical protein